MGKTAFIIITSKCNRKCPYCFYQQDSFRYKRDKFTSRNLIQTIKKLKDGKFNEVTFTGGEPLLKKRVLLEAIRKSNNFGFLTNLNTNGILLTQKTIKRLKSVGLKRLYISGNHLNFIPKKILDCAAKSIHLFIIFVITKENIGNLSGIMKKAKELGVELILQPAYIRKNNQYFQKLSLFTLDEKRRRRFLNTLKHWAERNKKNRYVELILSHYKDIKFLQPKKCHMGTSDIVIDSDGSVFPCFHRQDLLAGNVFKDSLRSISSKIKSFSRQTRKAACFGEHCISLFYS